MFIQMTGSTDVTLSANLNGKKSVPRVDSFKAVNRYAFAASTLPIYAGIVHKQEHRPDCTEFELWRTSHCARSMSCLHREVPNIRAILDV